MNGKMVQESEIVTEDGHPMRLAYDETGDVLEVVFADVEATCAVELTDNILLRFHRELGRAVGLTILDFSVLASPSELGPRSFALTGLERLPDDLREVVARIITAAPVNRFLKVSIFDSFSAHPIPLTYIESPYAAVTTA
jgi:YD repeat-containing protein